MFALGVNVDPAFPALPSVERYETFTTEPAAGALPIETPSPKLSS